MCVVNKESQSVKCFGGSPFPELIEEACRFLNKRGYKKHTIRNYRYRWNKLAQFVNQKLGADSFTVERALAFLDSEGIAIDQPGTTLNSGQRYTSAAVRMLTSLALHGTIPSQVSSPALNKLPPIWSDMLDGYVHGLANDLALQAGSVDCIRWRIRAFLRFLADQGVMNPAAIKAHHVSAYTASRLHLKNETQHRQGRLIAKFLQYLHLSGVHVEDLSHAVPILPVLHDSDLPAIWTSAEIGQLLGAVDRANPTGKRNYAILLMAARLGMRVGDIKRLRFENLRWEEEKIDFVQCKTYERLILPLTDEVGSAIIDYLKNGRPESEAREVFVSMRPPFLALGYSYALNGAFDEARRLAGIPARPASRCGMHSLRHTLASRMLEAGTPMQSISYVLGHASIESTKTYLRIDIVSLRRAALDIGEV